MSCGSGGARPPVLEPAVLDDVAVVFVRDEDWPVRGFELLLESLFFRLLSMLDLEVEYEEGYRGDSLNASPVLKHCRSCTLASETDMVERANGLLI